MATAVILAVTVTARDSERSERRGANDTIVAASGRALERGDARRRPDRTTNVFDPVAVSAEADRSYFDGGIDETRLDDELPTLATIADDLDRAAATLHDLNRAAHATPTCTGCERRFSLEYTRKLAAELPRLARQMRDDAARVPDGDRQVFDWADPHHPLRRVGDAGVVTFLLSCGFFDSHRHPSISVDDFIVRPEVSAELVPADPTEEGVLPGRPYEAIPYGEH